MEFLPTITPMPSPPKDNGDVASWQKHIMEVDRYILDLNGAIEKVENSDFAKSFKNRMSAQGVDVDQIELLPKPAMEEIARNVNHVLDGFKAIGEQLGIEAGKTHTRPIIKTQRNIKSI